MSAHVRFALMTMGPAMSPLHLHRSLSLPLQDRYLLRGLDVHADAGHIWSTRACDEDGPSPEMPLKWVPLHLTESQLLVCEAVYIALRDCDTSHVPCLLEGGCF